MSDDFWFVAADADAQAKERQAGKQLKKSPWWKNRLGEGKCHYCKGRFHPSELTMDHMTPIARGGRSTKRNCVPCCKGCNDEKKHMTANEWQAFQEKLECGEIEPGQGPKRAPSSD